MTSEPVTEKPIQKLINGREVHKIEHLWVQCDKCSKWRRIP